MTDGEEHTAFDIDPDAVDQAQKFVASLADECLRWRSADIDENENSLPEADKNLQRVDQLRRKAHDIRGQCGSFGFLLISRLADGLHLVMVSTVGPLSREDADLTRGLFAAMRIVVERRASGDGDATSRQAVDDAILKVEIRYDGL